MQSKRQLGVLVAASLVVANMIGAGVFTGAGWQASALHDPLTMMLTWVVGGVLALCGATCYAELGALMPHAGGEYVYLRDAYHPIVGTLSGWASMTAGFSAPIAAAAILFATYLGAAFGGIDRTTAKVLASLLVLAMSAMHAFDTRLGGRVQAGFTIAKTALIAAFIGAGLLVGHGDWSHLASQPPGLAQLGTTAGITVFATQLMFVSFAYSGWNAAAYIAGELEHPQRTLPRALVLGTVVVMALYILLNLVFLYAVPPAQMAGVEEVGALAARALFGATAGRMIATLIALALVSSVSAMVMAGPRVYAAMAADGALPGPLAALTRRGVPANAVVAQAVIAVAFVWAASLQQLVKLVGFTLAIFAALTVGAVFIFRRRGLRSPYRALGYPITPLLFIALSTMIVYLQVQQHQRASLLVLGILALAAAIYFVVIRPRGRQAPPAAGV